MLIEYMDIYDVIPYDKNSKKHDKVQVDKIKQSIKEFDFNVPIIVDKNNVVIAGHGRLLAAKQLGIQKVPVVTKYDLSSAQVKAFRIADNKVAESDWDFSFLKQEFESLKQDNYDFKWLDFDMEEIGLSDDDIEVEEDTVPEIEHIKTSIKLGDIFLLGEHRLMCGDSTSKTDIDKLMIRTIQNITFTDPPDNIAYKDMKGKHDEIKNDNMSEEDFIKFNNSWMKHITSDSGYICCNWKFYHIFYKNMKENNIPCKSCIVWDKEYGVQNLDKYHKQHEFILYFGKFGGEKTIRGDIFRLKRERSDLHPTMKPIELCSTFIKDSTMKGNLVYDPFGGSGSTLIACEQLNRKCYMMELSESYCEVICQRWEKLTGKERVKL